MGLTYEQLKAMGATPGGAPAPAAAPAAQAPAAAPADPLAPKKKYTYDELVAQGAQATPAAPVAPKEKKPGMLESLAKGIFGAPATLLARPVQAVAALAGADNADIDKFTEKIPVLGGLIAPTPKNYGDVAKDVGRGLQTVALGTGAPIAGGALFGAGTSLEQGNDLLSAETAINAAMGGAAGKVLALVGKPLLNAAGKVVGVVTPQTIKDVAAKGATAIQEFAATHQIAGGVAGPVSQKIAGGLQKVDDVIEGGVGTVFKGAKNVAQSQYPHVSATKHYQGINEKDIIRPTTVNEPKYSKATNVYNEAKAKGINLEEVASKRGIIHDKIAEGGRYNTTDTVDNIRQGNYEVSNTIARPAIKAAEPGVRLLPVSEVRNAMIKKVNAIPPSQIDDEAREMFIKTINRRYADAGPVARANPDGLSLTKLHDSRIVAGNNGGYKLGQSASDALKAQLSREEGRVFAQLFDETAPSKIEMDGVVIDAPFKAFRKELEQNFMLADYLETLHNKAVPAGITKKAARLFGRAVTATVGGKIGGFPGSILGAQYGDMLFSTFEAMPNPIKMRVLEAVKAESPKIFKELVEYIGKEEAARLMRPLLGPAGSSSFKKAAETLFTTPKGKTTPIKGEAFDVAAVETGKAKQPKTDRRLSSYINKVNYAQSADGVYTDPKDLPVIKTGPKPKSKKNLSDIL